MYASSPFSLCLYSYNIPLVADIHFAPTVALRVAECFDKIRVNPGNFGEWNLYIPHFGLSCFYYCKMLIIVLAADRRAQFEKLEYTDDDYKKELDHIEKVEKLSLLVLFQSMWTYGMLSYRAILILSQVFSPLVEKCKQYGRAMRIGTNHGSLSDRIMSYYGDSPRGMVIISILRIYLNGSI